jgi:hypothetical protein
MNTHVRMKSFSGDLTNPRNLINISRSPMLASPPKQRVPQKE